MKPYYIITIALILFSFTSCNESVTTVVESKQFYPLSVGNYWKYKEISYDSAGSNAVYDGTVWSERVLGDTVIYDEKWFYILTSRDSFMFAMPFKNTIEGLKINIVDTSLLFYKYPSNINDKYKYFSDTITVTAIDEITSTFAGNFKCIVYQKLLEHRPEGWIYVKTYISPGLGKIKMEGLFTSDKIKFIKRTELNLFEYKVY